MVIRIGSRYEETREMLAELIRSEKPIFLEVQPTNSRHLCYFCEKPILEKILSLKIREVANGRISETEFYLDAKCFDSTRFPKNFN